MLENLSPHGTWVNGEAVGRGASRALRTGDRIALVRGLRVEPAARGGAKLVADAAAGEEYTIIYHGPPCVPHRCFS